MEDTILIAEKTLKLAMQVGFKVAQSTIFITYKGDFENEEQQEMEGVMQSVLHKYILENHNLYIDVRISSQSKEFFFYIMETKNEYYTVHHSNGTYKTYELALEDGLIKALELIIK